MLIDSLSNIIEAIGLTPEKLDEIIDGESDNSISSILSGEAELTSHDIAAIEIAISMKWDFIIDKGETQRSPIISFGNYSYIAKSRTLQFLENYKKAESILDKTPNEVSYQMISSKDDVDSLISDIMASGKDFIDYLETCGIYTIELDRSKGFEGGLYSSDGRYIIVLNVDHSEKEKTAMLIELVSYSLLGFEDEMSEESIDSLCNYFCEELNRQMPVQKRFSNFNRMLTTAVTENKITTQTAANLEIVPIFIPKKL